MRACARVAFVSLVISVGFGLAGCGTFDRFSDTMTGWFESKKSPAESNPVSPEGVPSVTNSVSGATNEPTVRDGASGTKTADTPSEKKEKSARKPRRPQTAEAPTKPPTSAEPVQPQTAEPQSAPAQATPLQLPWPTAPPPGTFSR
jgi:hypothetical protein